MSKKDDNVLTKKVDGIGHDWVVIEKKRSPEEKLIIICLNVKIMLAHTM
ncbi:MAG: hypothetical protein ACW97W_17490 [Candidatus Hodarchaeales archaeon]